jgi:hypothetical protein
VLYWYSVQTESKLLDYYSAPEAYFSYQQKKHWAESIPSQADEVWRSYTEKLFQLDTLHRTFLYPHKEASKEEIRDLLEFSMEGRKRVKTEIYKIDRTFDPVEFSYKNLQTGEEKKVYTNEEKRYPRAFQKQEIDELEQEAFPVDAASPQSYSAKDGGQPTE